MDDGFPRIASKAADAEQVRIWRPRAGRMLRCRKSETEMRVNRAYQVTTLLFAALGIFLIVEGWKLGIKGMYSPGAGMFAAIVGLGLAVSCGIWFAQLTFGRGDRSGQELAEIDVDKAGLKRVALVILCLLLFPLLLEPLGFNLIMLILLLALLIGFGRDHLLLKVVIAFVFSFGTHYVFESLLRVPLPYASLAFLQSLGL
jgi:uncharacterized membrane protein